MNELLDFFTDVTMVAAISTASHFGITVETADTRTPAEAQRTVRRTAMGSSSARPAPRTMRAPAR
jgi:hypothetical protein